MHTLTYTAEFEISDYETVSKKCSKTFEDYKDALAMAHDLYFGDFGPERFYGIKIDGECIFKTIELPDDDLPF